MNKDKIPKMTMQEFGPWLQEKTGAKIMTWEDHTDCVVNIDHIDPGCFTALYVSPSIDGLAVFEMTDRFENEDDAWQALEDGAETYPPVLFEEWVGGQYLTDRNAKVEKLKI